MAGKKAVSSDVAGLKQGLDLAKIFQIIQMLLDFFKSGGEASPEKLKSFAKQQGCSEEEAELCALSCENLCAAMSLHLRLHHQHEE